MRTLITVHIILLSVVVVIFLIGLFLPKRKTVRRSISVNAVPEEIWKVIVHHELQPRWRTGLRKVKIMERTPSGDVWIEQPLDGPAATFRTIASSPPLRYEIGVEKSKGLAIRRFVELEKRSIHETTVSLEERSDITNPFTRVLARLQFDPGAALDGYLTDLSREMTRLANRLESQTS